LQGSISLPCSFLNHSQTKSGGTFHGVEHILWMFVYLRLLGSEPAAPSPSMTLFAYAAELEIQYCQLCVSVGAAASHQAREITSDLIRILGLPQAAEPLPALLLPLLFRNSSDSPTA
jgi:hypothetical protein